LGSLRSILPFGTKITDDVLEEVEEILYEADIGVYAVEKLIGELKRNEGEINRGETNPFTVMKETILTIIDRFDGDKSINHFDGKPCVILVIGVNGVGKTTTIGKMAMRFRNEGKTVLIAACDTFRAAAIEQLEIWAERSGSEFIKAHIGADAASIAYDAVTRAQAHGIDVVLIDTAGRLHTSFNLMNELKKIKRVLAKADETAPHETFLVIDATNGQNALSQAETFSRELNVTGIVLTKLDGTAKGGIAISIIDKLGIPIKLIGIGETLEDLRDFDPRAYTEALFAGEEKPGTDSG
jgi:fused signal recognition particle receptor